MKVCIHDHRAPADLSNNSSVCRVQGVHLGSSRAVHILAVWDLWEMTIGVGLSLLAFCN